MKDFGVTFDNRLRFDKHIKLDAGMWQYHANRMDARRSQFDIGRVDSYI